MGKLWMLCDECFAKCEKLKRALHDEEMCEECLLGEM